MKIIVFLVIMALLITKFLDLYSTIKCVNLDYERNPLYRIFSRFFEKDKRIYIIYTLALIAFCLILFIGIKIMLVDSVYIQILFVILGIVISIIQLNAALYNFGYKNCIAEYFLRLYKKI